MTGWHVRRAVVEDAPSIARINVAAWRSAYVGIVPDEYLSAMSTEQRTPRWQQILSTPGPYATFLALDADDAVAGYCSLGAQDSAELMAIYVDPARHRTGAGRAVHDAAIAWLRESDFDQAGLWVFAANERARAFYTAHGWAPDGTTHDDEIMGAVIPELRYTRPL